MGSSVSTLKARRTVSVGVLLALAGSITWFAYRARYFAETKRIESTTVKYQVHITKSTTTEEVIVKLTVENGDKPLSSSPPREEIPLVTIQADVKLSAGVRAPNTQPKPIEQKPTTPASIPLDSLVALYNEETQASQAKQTTSDLPQITVETDQAQRQVPKSASPAVSPREKLPQITAEKEQVQQQVPKSTTTAESPRELPQITAEKEQVQQQVPKTASPAVSPREKLPQITAEKEQVQQQVPKSASPAVSPREKLPQITAEKEQVQQQAPKAASPAVSPREKLPQITAEKEQVQQQVPKSASPAGSPRDVKLSQNTTETEQVRQAPKSTSPATSPRGAKVPQVKPEPEKVQQAPKEVSTQPPPQPEIKLAASSKKSSKSKAPEEYVRENFERKAYPRLLRLSGGRNVTVSLVPLSVSSLNQGDMFLLDDFKTVYQWGIKPSQTELVKATQLSRALDEERNSDVAVIVISNLWDLKDSDARRFWELLGIPPSQSPPEKSSLPTDDTLPGFEPQLFVVSDASGTLEFKQVASGVKNMKKSLLRKEDVMIFDSGFEIVIWEGSGATKQEKSYANDTAAYDYIKEKKRPANIAVYRCLDGGKNEVMKFFFDPIN